MTNALAEHPPLAGTLNRQAGMKALAQATQDAKASQQPLAVLTLDVDHFKPFQDEAGDTQAGIALTLLVEVLQQTLPEGTSITHLGSDEFFVTLPGSGLAAAQTLAESLRGAVERGLSGIEAAPRLTVTLGVAASPAEGQWDDQTLLALADMRMTFAKRRLTPHHNLVWAGTLPSDWHARLDIDPARWPSL